MRRSQRRMTQHQRNQRNIEQESIAEENIEQEQLQINNSQQAGQSIAQQQENIVEESQQENILEESQQENIVEEIKEQEQQQVNHWGQQIAQFMEQPQQAQQQQQQQKFINPKKFLQQIPNIQVFRDFLINQGKFYVPPFKDFTSKFCKDILSGQKRLLKLSKVLWVDQVPRWKKFTVKYIWPKTKIEPVYTKYFPTYSDKYMPSRKYLLNVINTVIPQSVVKGVIKVKKEREQQIIQQSPMIITNEFAELLKNFNSISNDQRRKGLQNLGKYPKCSLCLEEMRSNLKKFNCQKHTAHSRCIKTYYASELGRNSLFACPMRCPKQ